MTTLDQGPNVGGAMLLNGLLDNGRILLDDFKAILSCAKRHSSLEA